MAKCEKQLRTKSVVSEQMSLYGHCGLQASEHYSEAAEVTLYLVEKTIHPCQFPVELVERLVLSMTRPGDLVVDPYMGVGSTAVAAVMHKRRAAGAEIVAEYVEIAKKRVALASIGMLPTRPMGRPVYIPSLTSKFVRREEPVQ